ncbi:helix-turn-helix transcriptional regulator [Mesorhizobium sp. Z1-4]|uniref:helix-turn-helix domain-containing protein n=1 Tax=Mesorhizobium sp. Z1-4 TaxID=2448478 RepID=UPI000FDC71AA|nr:helix-turn-helix transcriptional regulator [Mesorhizobium sp. Z1-4]
MDYHAPRSHAPGMIKELEQLKKRIGYRVKAARKAANITQAQLASDVSKSVEAISNIERGQSLAPIDTLFAISRVLGTTLVHLVDDQEAFQNSRKEEAQAALAASIRNLDEDQTRLAMRLVESIRGESGS